MFGRLRIHQKNTPSTVLATACLLLTATSLVSAQPPTASTETSPPPATPPVTSEQIDADLKLVEDSTELDDATKTQLKDLLAQAQAALAQTEAATKQTEQFRAWIDTAPEDLKAARSRQEEPPQGFDLDEAESWNLDQLVAKLALLDKQLDDTRSLFTEAQAEPVRRSARLTEISNDLSATRTKLTAIDDELKNVPSNNGADTSQRVKRLQLAAQRQAAVATIESLESERTAYEAQGELPRLRSQVAERLVTQLSKDAKQLSQLVSRKRQADAQAQKQEANAALRAASDLLKPFAQKTVDRADQRNRRAEDLQLATPKCTAIAEDLQRWGEDFRRTQARADKGASATLGIVLLQKQSRLPDASQYRKEIAKRVWHIRSLQGELLEQEDRLVELADAETAAGTTIAKLRTGGKPLPPNAGDQLVNIYRLERRILSDLHSDTDRFFSRLVTANEDQEALADEVEEYDDFIRQRIFWIRSIAPLALDDLSNASDAFAWLVSSPNRQDLVATLRAASPPRMQHLAAAACIALLTIFRRRMRKKVDKLGEIASAPLCRLFTPTMQALPLTLLLAALLPAVLFLAAGITDTLPTEFPLAVAAALNAVAVALLSTLLTIEVCRPKGIAEAHLGWSTRSLAIVRKNLRWLLIAGPPLLFLVVLFVHQSNPLYRASAGRLCHVALMTLSAFVIHRIFQPNGGVLEEIDPKGTHGWLNRYRAALHVGLVLLPAAVALLSILGFYYTARQLSTDFLRSFELVFCLFIAEGILYRWVRVKRRQIRWQQLLDARERRASGEQAPKDDLAELAAEEEEVDLGEIDHQTRRLIDSSIAIVGLVGLWTIWASVLPALNFLDTYGLWSVEAADGVPQLVSIGDLILAVLIAVFTFIAAKNIPGLIDIALLNRLTLESSLRYAVSTLCQYAITIVGALAVCHLVGIRWGNAQWLVAALSVGLGFGLQEVVANFVCGILLLFERPIRVGDTVTLGDTTGVVVRIRSRATTVRNWDRQEVIVPNKELITGRIVNWTLSDQLNRIVLTVGIAYGSDTQRAREILAEILKQQPTVLDDPQPLITFEQFGDSTLNFVVRAILSDMGERLSTTHDLHTQINDRFAKEGIEIAFPQQDLHIRSVETPLNMTSETNKDN
jgi:small-conductance mechanosensitive channel